MAPSPPIHILVVDDEPSLLEITKEFLELDQSISADTASSAVLALDMIKLQEYDAIVSDYQMPGKDGIQLLKEIRGGGNKTPFILFTGKGREDIAIEAFENGADFYLQKGGETRAQFGELEHKIKKAIDLRLADLEVIALNRLYNVLSATNKAILRIHDRNELLIEICRIVIDIGGFLMVWAGRINPETHMIEPLAAYGHIDGYLDTISASTEDATLEQGPIGTAIRERRYNVSNDIESDPTMALWREETLKRGYRSLATFPFALDTKNAGVISYYAPRPEFFTDRIIRLLDEQTDDLSFAFTILDHEEQRKSAEKNLRNSETRYRRLFETAQDAILILDGNTGVIIEANAFILDLLGYPLEYCIGKHLWELGFIKDKTLAQQAFDELKTKGYIRYEDLPLETKDGRSINVDFISHAFVAGDKKIFQCSIRDITSKLRVEDLLLKSEKRLWTYMDYSPEGIFIVDARGNYQDVNKTACTMLNYSREELLGLNIMDISDKSAIQEVMEKFQELQKKGSMTMETILIRKDGTGLPIFLNAVELPDHRYMAFCTDITGRNRVGEEQERTRSWRNGVNKILESILAPSSLDQKLKSITDGVVETFGADFCRIWLIESGDLCDKGCMHAEVTDGPHICQFRDKCLHLRSSSGRYTHIDGEGHRRVPFNAYKIGRIASGKETRFLTNDAVHDPQVHNHEWAKSLGLVAFSGYRLKPLDGDVLGVFALFTKSPISPDMDASLEGLSRVISLVVQKDIAERSLLESERQIRTMIEQSPLSIQVMTMDGHTMQVNHAFNELWGLTLEDLKDYNMLNDEQLIRLGTMPLIKKGFSGEATAVPPMQYDSHEVSDPGKKKWVEGNIYPIRDELGIIRNVIIMHHDITERIKAEDGLRMASQKLNILSRITRHDINNQLTALMGYLELVEEERSDAPPDAHLQKAEAAAKRISEMIQFTKNYEDIGLNAPLWQNVRTSIENGAKNVTLGFIKFVNDVPADIEIFADPLITKVFHNLVDNAVRHGDKITTIRFSIEEHENVHTLICEDDGVGIAEEIKKTLFVRSLESDHGLGLFLSREILAITGITIVENGEVSKGARFEITVPAGNWRRSKMSETE